MWRGRSGLTSTLVPISVLKRLPISGLSVFVVAGAVRLRRRISDAAACPWRPSSLAKAAASSYIYKLIIDIKEEGRRQGEKEKKREMKSGEETGERLGGHTMI